MPACRDQWTYIVFALLFLIVSPFVSSADEIRNQADEQKLNLVLIVIDDLGWADVGCYGSGFYETPRIDALASAGMRFTDAYATSLVCSPTRASLMTGKYPARLQLTDYLVGRRQRIDSPMLRAHFRHALPREEVTLAEKLKQAGYRTAHIGKWHLGGRNYWPEDQGFDVNIAGCGSGMPLSFFWPQWKKNPPIKGRRPGDYLPDLLAEKAVQFIENNRDQPFFLNLCHYAVHVPLEAPADRIAKYKKKKATGCRDNPVYAAMVESIDRSVGRVMDTLKRLGLAKRTVIIFTSDNGGLSVKEGPKTPATCNAPLRAGKGHLYEGGIRVPFIVHWPGHASAGSVCHTPVSSIDVMPTICALADVPVDTEKEAIDGRSLVPLLTGKGEFDRDALYWHYPHFSNQGGRPGGVIRCGNFKLIERYESGTVELYNLADDISETRDLALALPEKARQLRNRLHQWQKSVHANMPQANPNFQKAQPPNDN
jgi:arylsulfatase A